MNSPEFAAQPNLSQVFASEIDRIVRNQELDTLDRQAVMLYVADLGLSERDMEELSVGPHMEKCEIAKINNIYDYDGEYAVLEPVHQVVFTGEIDNLLDRVIYEHDETGLQSSRKVRDINADGKIGMSRNIELMTSAMKAKNAEERARIMGELQENIAIDQAATITPEDDPDRFRTLNNLLKRL